MTSTPHPLPTFHSCRYCRHRKKKCVLPPPDAPDSRCFACQRLNTPCEIDTRKPSVKRQLKSQRIASGLSANSNKGLGPASTLQSMPGENALIRVGNGDCQIPRSPGEHGADKTIIIESPAQDTERMAATEVYHSIVQRDFPFVPTEYLASEDSELSPVLDHCIRLAAQLSLQSSCSGMSDADLQSLLALLNDEEAISLSDAAGLMLLLPRIQPEPLLIMKAFMPVSAAGASLDTPLPIAAGALAANTWLALVGYTVPLPASRPSILLDYMRGLDQTTFAPHYLKLTYLGASFLNLRSIADQERTAKSTVMSWAELEYTTLLNVVQMPSEYLDVRDEMPATPGAVVTHMLQSLVFLRIYDHLLCQEPALGQSLGLRPVPGVVHFLCVIARSVLTCPPQIVKHWPILDEVQASSAQTLLNIWQLTEAENCRALLNLWKPTPGRFDDLSREVRAKIGSGPWDVEVIDGYSVFWVFRDLRSLSLEMHMRDRDQDL